jgi:outer membrane receptor protein involved in Fe transport
MMANRNVTRAVRLALIAASTAAAGAYAPGTLAQEAELEQIVVTGSRIASTGLDSPSPLQIVGSADIDASGVANIQDLLLKSPVFGNPAISRTNSNFSTSSAGVSTIDLRDLGVSRTLVLVNGRRFVAGIPGESAVDLNVIPTQFVERVEVLTGGASAVYGSDAVAGVVNFVMKNNFEGVEFNGQYGRSNRGDDEQTVLGVTMGTTVADGRGHMMAHLGYSDQGAVFSADRSRSAVDQFSRAVAVTGDPADFFTPVRPFFSSFAPQGRFFRPNGTSYTFDADGNPVPWSTNGSPTLEAQGFNRTAFRTIAIPTERYIAAATGEYEIVDNHSAFVELNYAATEAVTELEPFPLDSQDLFPGTGGQVPLEFESFQPDGAGGFNRVVLQNPTVPDYVFSQAADEDGDGLRDVFFTRRTAEIGNRGSTADRDTFRLLGGFKGDLFDNSWNYDTFYAYGKTTETQVSGGQVNVLNFRYALEAIPDLDDIDADGNTAEAICRDASAREQGCVPVSVYGAGSMSPEAVNYIRAPGLLSTTTTQKLAGLNLSSEIMDLPAGPLGIALGAEYREEEARSEFDALQQAGLNAGNAIPATEGGFHVIEGYLETRVPILADMPFADSLSLNGAVRFSDYSTVGNTESWNVGLEWAPLSQVRFRTVLAQSTRAPNINELYSPASQDFPTGLVDPCNGVTATSTGTVSERCRAESGVLDNIIENGEFGQTQADLQGISSYVSGNPTLTEEEGDSFTVGVVIQPTGIAILENFAFTIDYFDIEVDEAIVTLDRQFILDQCYGGDQSFCRYITRRDNRVGANSSGSLEFVDTEAFNAGTLATEGIDLTIAYAQQIGPGDFNARLAYTHYLDGYEIPVPGGDENPYVGEVGSPEDSAFLTLGYNIGQIGLIWQMTYIGESYLDDQFLASFDLAPESYGVDDVWYHDVQATWTFSDRTELYAGVNNLFDEDPAPVISGLPGNSTGTETDAGTYDAVGMRFYGGFRMKF